MKHIIQLLRYVGQTMSVPQDVTFGLTEDFKNVTVNEGIYIYIPENGNIVDENGNILKRDVVVFVFKDSNSNAGAEEVLQTWHDTETIGLEYLVRLDEYLSDDCKPDTYEYVEVYLNEARLRNVKHEYAKNLATGTQLTIPIEYKVNLNYCDFTPDWNDCAECS